MGVPVLGSVIDIYSSLNSDDVNGIVSDGGINSYGDIVKAIAAGASAVMMGKMFAGHDECDNSYLNGINNFRGLASESIQKEMIENNVMDIRNLYVEGISGSVASKGGIENTLTGIRNSIQSGMSYNGSNDIKHFQKTSRFIKVSSKSLLESNTRLN
jgi:IMP dehydrogenase